MIVVKIGGGKGINIQNIADDVAAQKEQIVLVHGANYYLDYYSKKLGIEKKILTSPTGLTSRYTDKKVIDLMYLTYAGLSNKTLVAALQKAGKNAIGLSGIDARLLIGKKHAGLVVMENGKKKVVNDDLTGSMTSVNTDLLMDFFKRSITPVITSPIMTNDNEVINVDGDKIASSIAVSLKADTVLFLIEAAGVLEDSSDDSSMIASLDKASLEKLVPCISGRMKRKVLECIKLLNAGVKNIIIADGRIQQPITYALKGRGTHVS